jgi:hypothetical protein
MADSPSGSNPTTALSTGTSGTSQRSRMRLTTIRAVAGGCE